MDVEIVSLVGLVPVPFFTDFALKFNFTDEYDTRLRFIVTLPSKDPVGIMESAACAE
ncbi:hypothetical protein D3C72_2415700 [compost metagenome]